MLFSCDICDKTTVSDARKSGDEFSAFDHHCNDFSFKSLKFVQVVCVFTLTNVEVVM